MKGILGFMTQGDNYNTSPIGLDTIKRERNMMMVILIWRKRYDSFYIRERELGL